MPGGGAGKFRSLLCLCPVLLYVCMQRRFCRQCDAEESVGPTTTCLNLFRSCTSIILIVPVQFPLLAGNPDVSRGSKIQTCPLSKVAESPTVASRCSDGH